jgi:excisionase family DNA binding protein
MKINNENQWLTLKDVISWTSLSASTIRRAIHKGELKASTATGKHLFKLSSVERWLNG